MTDAKQNIRKTVNFKMLPRLGLPYCFVLLLVSYYVSAVETELFVFEIDDDAVGDSYIGNIVEEANLDTYYTQRELRNLTYVFLSEQGLHRDYFTLNSRSGDLTTKRLVDRDVICTGAETCALNIDIAIRPAQFHRILKAVMVINDRNDHSPEFEQDTVRYEIPESTSPGVVAPVVTASDPDSPRYGVVRYILDSDTDLFSLNVRNVSGTYDLQLVLNSALDRETEDRYQVKVLATDGGAPSRTGTLTLNIDVLDVNDNSPVFESNINEVSVPENLTPGSIIYTVHATDADLGQNGRVYFQFSPDTITDLGNVFSIDSLTGHIKLLARLDYEQQQSYSLVVVANDEGQDSLPTSTRVIVHVNDVNDNRPSLTKNPNTTVHIAENNEPSAFIAHISVIDLDDEQNGFVECFLNGDYGRFDIQEVYEKEFKITATSQLDFEYQNIYNLRIRCQDYGIPSYSTEEQLLVNVTDLNDNAPMFAQETYHITLQENNPVRVFLLRVSAVDPDTENGGIVTYSLNQEDRETFEIDRFNGNIRVLSSLNREDEPVIEFEVIASDAGTPSLSSTATVVLELTDVNDDQPRFQSRMYHFNISENMPQRSEVGRVIAIDRDSAPNNGLFYFLEQSRSAVDTFSIDPLSGVVYTKRDLDREEVDSYTLVVIVQSENSPNEEDSSTVEIYVTDENDNRPVVSLPGPPPRNKVTLPSRAPVNYHITRIQANDPDEGMNGRIEFEIIRGNEDLLFRIDYHTGDIFLNRKVDNLDDQIIPVEIMIRDKGTPPQTTIYTLGISVNSSALAYGTSPNDPTDAEAVKVEKGSDDTAIIVGCICGLLVIILAITLVIVLIIRIKRKQGVRRPLYTAQPSTPTKEHEIIDFRMQTHVEDTGKDGKTDSPSKRAPIPIKVGFGQVVSDDTTPENKVKSPQANGTVRRGRNGEGGDNDSGCADLSQGSSEETNIQGACLVQTRCYHPKLPAQNQSPDIPKVQVYSTQDGNPRFSIRHATVEKTDGRISSHHELVRSRSAEPRGMEQRSNNAMSPNSVHFNLQPPMRSPSPIVFDFSPSANPTFSEWLKNENKQLKTQGHKYNVGGPKKSQSLHSSKGVPIAKAAKTVRFSEPVFSGDDSASDTNTTQSPPPICIRASYGKGGNKFVLDLTKTNDPFLSANPRPNPHHPVVKYPMDAYASYQSPEEEDGSLV